MTSNNIRIHGYDSGSSALKVTGPPKVEVGITNVWPKGQKVDVDMSSMTLLDVSKDSYMIVGKPTLRQLLRYWLKSRK